MKTKIHTEARFESEVEASLLDNGGYVKGISEDFEPSQGLFPSYITDFLKVSQPKLWDKITEIHKSDVEQKVINVLIRDLDTRGSLDVFRNGFTNYGVKFSMAFFKPESNLNPESLELYNKNHLSVTRQLYYQVNGRNSLDMVLSLNGLPIAT